MITPFIVFLSPVRLPPIILHTQACDPFHSDHSSENPLPVSLYWLGGHGSTFWSFPSLRACSGGLGQLCPESDAPISTLLKCSNSHHPCLPQQSSFSPWPCLLPSCSSYLPFLTLWWPQRVRWWEEVCREEMKSPKEPRVQLLFPLQS